MKNNDLNNKLRFEKRTITSLKLEEQKNVIGGRDTLRNPDTSTDTSLDTTIDTLSDR